MNSRRLIDELLSRIAFSLTRNSIAREPGLARAMLEVAPDRRRHPPHVDAVVMFGIHETLLCAGIRAEGVGAAGGPAVSLRAFCAEGASGRHRARSCRKA
jgi:hypothetical protein